MCVSSDGDSERTSKPEVGKFYDTGGVYEEVLWLQVPVEDSVGVAECYSIQHLVDVGLQCKENNEWGSCTQDKGKWRCAGNARSCVN